MDKEHKTPNTNTAGYEPDGTLITYTQLRQDIAEAEQEFEAGQGVSQEELRVQIIGWRNRKQG